jgi:hypothetical protein
VGTPLAFLEPESEHSSASAAEGFALAGGRVVNFTAGQGLILMKEVLYVIAGKRLPVVFHIGARALTSQSLNIHAGHDDGRTAGRVAQDADRAAPFTPQRRGVPRHATHTTSVGGAVGAYRWSGELPRTRSGAVSGPRRVLEKAATPEATDAERE